MLEKKLRNMKFNLKKLFDTDRYLVGFCGVLLIVNIAVFVYLSATMPVSVPFVIISNVITIFLMLMIFRPVNKILQEAVLEQKHEEQEREEKLRLEKAELEKHNQKLQGELSELSLEKEKLKTELDSVKQYNSLSNDVRTVLKLETMNYEKEGYIVKEENVRDTGYGLEIPGNKPLLLNFSDKGEQKVLYTHKYHDKALIGIDLTKVRLCKKDGNIYFEGVKFENLHPEMTVKDSFKAYENQNVAINRCIILNVETDKTTINNDSKYNEFKRWYSENQDKIFELNFNAEVCRICDNYTRVLRQTLSDRFPQIVFLDGKIEHFPGLENPVIKELEICRENDILQISNSMLMVSAAIKNTMPAINNP